ncbi:T7SS effector LXG polymorphic toxin [Fictibacillus phosphorivorans]|uniref:T7SS effector LXG polymorphic toxin n=1 Tax=Fictibacillus phosphorivorans TaxID=1221500 RepID=UPI00129300D7|nr:T7SS effector LXG polymorphic toxin [Fictibacillus phosphorivorans]MQR94657.1 transposase [Fictibacillus phosphorivorans]
MGSKVYEASTLKAATSERAHHYEQLREQFETLKKEFSKIVENHDFKGHGADAIKGFYQGQMDVIDAWIRLIDTNVGFFKGIPGDTEDVDLSGDTFVQVPFLEENVERAGKQTKDMVADQQEALQHIFNRVNDLVSLSVFSKDAFEDQMDKAEKKRSDTVEKVNEFDQRLSEEYSISQNQEQHIYGLFAQLMEATRQGETISPLNFNAEAYHNSEVYKAIGQAKKDTSDYLSFKKQQKEDRRIAKEIEEMENRPFYEKAWDTVCTFTGEVTGYYDTQRAATGVDPVTGRKLSDAERVTSGAMAAAGFVPFVGWAGRIGKGGSAVYKTVKGANAANHMLDAHRTAQGLKNLQKAEYGIYGLVSANGFGEYFTGKDMFGNELTEEQRNQSLFNAFAIVGVGGAGYGLSKVDMGKFVQTKFPYSTQYARQKLMQAEEMAKTIKHNVGNTHIPVGFKVHAFASPTGHVIRTISSETKTVKELMQQASIKYGDHYTKINRRRTLKPNVEYTTKEGYKYVTDDIGRITTAEAKLELGKGKRNSYAQRTIGREDRLTNDDGGHLIASIFKGSGEIDNLVPMNSTLNRSEYKTLENTWKKALEEGKEVIIKVKPIYEGQSTRPSEFKINYSLDGKKYSDRLTNYPGGT